MSEPITTLPAPVPFVDSTAPSASQSPPNLDSFRTYLSNLLPAVLGATPEDVEDSLFHESEAAEFQDRAAKFIGDSNVGVVYVVQVRQEEVEGDSESCSFKTGCPENYSRGID